MGKYSKIIRWGIIGCGDVTEVKSGPAFNLTESFKLNAVMRRNLDKAKDYAKRHGVPKYFNDADKLINDPEVDAVYIATPPDSHLLYGLKVAAAGKPCCIEKPLTPSYYESLAIYEAFEKQKIPLFVAYYRRSLPRFLKIKEWIDQNEIGDLRHISWQLHYPPSDLDHSGKYNWRTDPKVAPGGYFDDLASHGLDLFTFYLGNVKNASGNSLNQQKLYAAPDAVTGSWIYENGVTGSGFWNFGCKTAFDKVKILGSDGNIQFSIFGNNSIILNKAGEIRELKIEHPRHIQFHHVQDMRNQLLDPPFKHPSNAKTALHTSWFMDKILSKI